MFLLRPLLVSASNCSSSWVRYWLCICVSGRNTLWERCGNEMRFCFCQMLGYMPLIYYLTVCCVHFSREAFLPAAPLSSVYVKLLLYIDLDIIHDCLQLLHTFHRIYSHNCFSADRKLVSTRFIYSLILSTFM